MYPTFVDICGLQPDNGLEGKSLAAPLRDPSQATDRNVFLPYLDPGGYAIINQKWRYIHYSDNTEELYDVRADPHEWYNLANDSSKVEIKNQLRRSAPATFAPVGTSKKQLKLVIEGEGFDWEPKPNRRRP